MAEITVSQLDMANSRILTVGSSIDKALDLISQPSDSPSASSSKVPWTISNKYYSADVHFAAHSIKGLAPYHVQNVPAVLFVWSKGEEYRSHILRLAQDLEGYEPEVVLAVRTHTSADIPVEDQLNDEEEEGEENLPATVHGEGRTFSQGGIPTLPRVLDALSTIMWPNMKQPSKQSGGYRGLGALLDLTPGSREDSLASIDSLVTRPGDSSEQQNRRQKEMEALERWLEDDVRDERGQDPWKINSEKAGLVHSPVEGTHNIPNPSSSSPKAELAFDDDFSVFVSAPPAESGIAKHGDDISFSSPMFSENDSGLKAAPLGELYHSLGSTSDLGDMDPHSPISPLPSSSSKPPPYCS
ncbi:hypothetical protein DL96DRAFT_1737852 [Flagelloscypha sp. PMI_526]|nr:hypothetical protein DL96DRAFT_1737852 [Flagelloscypha sp. PMI_526]